MSLVVESRPADGPVLRTAAPARPQIDSEYYFLLDRFIDPQTLAHAEAQAAQWGVHPHDVLIATGRLRADDYYGALAETCGAAFRPAFAPTETALPAKATPQQCLANGILKERARARRFVLAPERLRSNALRSMLARLAPYHFTLTTPRAVRDAVRHHFAAALARGAVDALAVRRPAYSARTGMAPWQRLTLALATVGFILALWLAPVESIRVATLLLAVLFVPVIGLRAVAANRLLRGHTEEARPAPSDVPDAALPTYTILAPLFREAHMLPGLLGALTRLDWPALGSKGTKA